jgi:hypothetical protein
LHPREIPAFFAEYGLLNYTLFLGILLENLAGSVGKREFQVLASENPPTPENPG